MQLKIQYISDYLNISESEVNKQCLFIKMDKLPDYLFRQYQFFEQKYIEDALLVVVPDKLMSFKERGWHQACPEQKISVFKQSAFERGEDTMAMLVHDLAHIEQYAMIGDVLFEEYRGIKAFQDIQGTYPNNITELYAFGRQFEYLYLQNINIEYILSVCHFVYKSKKSYMEFINRMIKQSFKLS